jgi:hypothetical protein
MRRFEVHWERSAVDDDGLAFRILELWREDYPNGMAEDVRVDLYASPVSQHPLGWFWSGKDYEMSATLTTAGMDMHMDDVRQLAIQVQRSMLRQVTEKLNLVDVQQRQVRHREGQFIR